MSGKGNDAHEKFDREFGERNRDLIDALMQPRRQLWCWPSLGEACGECHRCGNPSTSERETAENYGRNDHQ